jgi:hypothetical protein
LYLPSTMRETINQTREGTLLIKLGSPCNIAK